MFTAAETFPAIGVHLQARVFVPSMKETPRLILSVQFQPQAAGYRATIFLFQLVEVDCQYHTSARSMASAARSISRALWRMERTNRSFSPAFSAR